MYNETTTSSKMKRDLVKATKDVSALCELLKVRVGHGKKSRLEYACSKEDLSDDDTDKLELFTRCVNSVAQLLQPNKPAALLENFLRQESMKKDRKRKQGNDCKANFFATLPQLVLSSISEYVGPVPFQNVKTCLQYFSVVNLAIAFRVESVEDLRATQDLKNVKVAKITLESYHKNKNITSSLIQFLKKNNNITDWELEFHEELNYHCELDRELAHCFVAAMRSCGKLTQLSLTSNVPYEDIISIWKSNKFLHSLSIFKPIVADANVGMTLIANSLKVDTKLKYLGLYGFIFDDTSILSLADALRINKALKRLDLNSCSLSEIPWVGIRALSESLKLNNTLSCLYLCDVKVGNTGAQILAELLKVNKSLKEISLGLKSSFGSEDSDIIGEVGCVALAKSLKANKNLKVLNLCENYIGDAGAQFAEALKLNDTLKILDLSWCDMSNSSALELAKCLKYNTGLVYLNLADFGNHDYVFARSLDKALQTNTTLEWIAFSFNITDKISSKQCVYHGLLMDALQSNTTLKFFRVHFKWSYEAHSPIYKTYMKLLEGKKWVLENESEFDIGELYLEFRHSEQTLSEMIQEFHDKYY